MKGYIYITSSGFDPEEGKNLKDPSLEGIPTLGACRPDIREQVNVGDEIFVISGRVRKFSQYVVGGFEVAEKVPAIVAYQRFPEKRLRKAVSGELVGNVIVDDLGNKHFLDHHKDKLFERRIKNYIIGRNAIILTDPWEIAQGRRETLDMLKCLFGKEGKIPRDIIGRCSKLDESQIVKLRDWLSSLKTSLKMAA